MQTFYLQHGRGTAGPFRTESVRVKESWKPQPRRGTVTACRYMVNWYGRWYRVYSDHAARSFPHFIRYRGERIIVDGVCP